MNVVHVISEFAPGGAEAVAIALAINQAHKHKVTVITLRRGFFTEQNIVDQQKEMLKKNNVDIVEIGGKNFKLNFLLFPFKLANIFNSLVPDIVHSHTDQPDICVSLANRIRKVNIVRTIHNTKIWDAWWLPGLISESGFQDDLVVSISGDTAKTYHILRDKYRLKSSVFQRIIKNGVNSVKVEERLERHELAERFGADLKNFQVGVFGRITFQKGIDILVDAIKIMKATQVECHVFGDGEDRQRLSRQAAKLGLPVRFHGPIAGAQNVMSAFDLIVMPSRFEGFPLVGLEAQMVATPLLVTDAPGLREVVSPEWPLVVPPEDASALADMLDQIVFGAYDLDCIRCIGAEWVEKLSVENMALQYEDAYHEFLGKKANTLSQTANS